MAKSRNDHSRYPSRYSSNIDADGFAWVSGRQYIVEMVCENLARKQKKELPRGFYTKQLELTEWQTFYREQINNRSLSKLIDKHSVDKIISFLKNNSYIISLRPKWVHDKLEEYTYTSPTPKQESSTYDFDNKSSFTSNNNKKSVISRLEELE